MAHLGEAFDPDSAEPRDSIDPVPAGVYSVEAVESNVVKTKSGSGMMVVLTYKITEGSLEGRRIWDRINYRNNNEVAQKIGQQQLAELCAACGHRGPLEDTEVLHGIPIKVRVAIENDESGNYGPSNVIKRYMPYDDRSAPQSGNRSSQEPARSSQPSQKNATTGSRPWGNGGR